VQALHQAARHTGLDPALLAAMAWRESRFDPRARNRLSTARGLMQFTEQTWLETIRDHGAKHGLARQAATLSTDARSGTVSARNPRDLAYLLALRHDPRLSAALAAERVAAQRPAVEALLRRPATAADLYAVHLLGPAGARRFLAELLARPSGRAADAVGAESVGLNRNLFFARDGRAFSLLEVHGGMAQGAAEGRALLAAHEPPELVLLAEARP
jgi:hypothetical protein